jgi:carbamoyltransferase
MVSRKIIGISAFYHDSAAALIIDGKVVAAAQEERFTRLKNDSSFPKNSIEFLLSHGNINPEEITDIIFYDKPWLKFERILESNIRFAPFSLKSYLMSIPIWLSKKFNMRKLISTELGEISSHLSQLDIKFSEHHLSHAASSFYTSPFNDACSVTIDGVGEWATLSIHKFTNESVELIEEMIYPNSIGLLYSSFTYFCGFRVNSGEYKLMGLAPYGDIKASQTQEFIKKMHEELFNLNDDGSIEINLNYFSYHLGDTMVNDMKFLELFGISRRAETEEVTQAYCNFALASQLVIEKIIIKIIKYAHNITSSENLCLSGGVALNCVANEKIKALNLFENIWIHPSPGDAGGAIGSALALYFDKNKYYPSEKAFSPYLGPDYSTLFIEKQLKLKKIAYHLYDDNQLDKEISKSLNQGKVVGWFQGQMEWGPRALGNRSILAEATNVAMQRDLNLKIKLREGFRPFAPVVLEEHASEFFNLEGPSPFMQYTAKVLNSSVENQEELAFFKRLTQIMSPIPAVTHLDLSARVQTVSKINNAKLHSLLEKYNEVSGVPVLINTSFNVRGEPIVCSPQDAIDCFLSTQIDILVLNNYVIYKNELDSSLINKDRFFNPD